MPLSVSIAAHRASIDVLCPTNSCPLLMTYSKDDGSGEQIIYLNENMLNDTLTVIGCLNEDYCKSLKFIVMER